MARHRQSARFPRLRAAARTAFSYAESIAHGFVGGLVLLALLAR